MRIANSNARAFTLVELLAAMAFMAIVIPVTVQGLQIATRAGMVGQRKAVAARVLDSVLTEFVANSSQSRSGVTSGFVQEGELEYQWRIQIQNWSEDQMRLVTCDVTYPAQGHNFTLSASTLIDQGAR
jgi:type II secretion system protein I